MSECSSIAILFSNRRWQEGTKTVATADASITMCLGADRLWGKIVNAHASGQKWAWVSE
jgi:hypothetical protein